MPRKRNTLHYRYLMPHSGWITGFWHNPLNHFLRIAYRHKKLWIPPRGANRNLSLLGGQVEGCKPSYSGTFARYLGKTSEPADSSENCPLGESMFPACPLCSFLEFFAERAFRSDEQHEDDDQEGKGVFKGDGQVNRFLCFPSAARSSWI